MLGCVFSCCELWRIPKMFLKIKPQLRRVELRALLLFFGNHGGSTHDEKP